MRARLELLLPLAMILAASSVSAQTRVYESEDAEGNPVFSDEPDAGARTIEIPPANSADAPPPGSTPAPAADTHSADRTTAQAPVDKPSITVIGGNSDDESDDGFVRERTPEGDILVNKRERDKLDQDPAIYRGSHRITIKQPHNAKKRGD